MKIRNKKILLFTLSLLTFSFLFISNVIANVVNEEDLNNSEQSTKVVEDLDIGDVQKEMEIGSSQMLSVTIIPDDATPQDIKYTSSDVNVATINALGRITPVNEGSTNIIITCGNIVKTVKINVVNKKTDEIKATKLEIADFDKNLKVGDTLSLQATVIPTNSTETEITYKSTNEKIATVSSLGEVKGLSKGKVIIVAKVGQVIRKIKINVVVPTTQINVDSSYLVLKAGSSHNLKVDVFPKNAPQNIKFKSKNKQIALVDTDGKIYAKSSGNTTIIISNGDTSVSVVVIVNKTGKSDNAKKYEINNQINAQKEYKTKLSVTKCNKITKSMLSYYSKNNKKVVLTGECYSIIIYGKNIVNVNNELNTEIDFNEYKNGYKFTVNKNKNLCGKISIIIDNDIKGKYLYLYNQSKKKYEEIKVKDVHQFEISDAGQYLITESKINKLKINKSVVGYGGVAIFIASAVFILLRRRYWFW